MLLRIFIGISLAFVLHGCKQQERNFLQASKKPIGLQPIGNIDTAISNFLAHAIDSFFGRAVIILPAIPTGSGHYDADSLLTELGKSVGKKYAAITAITHGALYERMRSDNMEYMKPILGFGLLPGNVSVASDERLVPASGREVMERLKKIVLHEMGHNLGLQHCPERHCLMSSANGHPSVLHEAGNSYCPACRKRLKW